MHAINEYSLRSKKLDFSSSEQPLQIGTQVMANGHELINAYELMHWDDPNLVQFYVCEACGIPACGSGGWISLRRIPEAVVLVPAFGEYMEAKSRYPDCKSEPSGYFREMGVPYIPDFVYEKLRADLPQFPPKDSLADLTEGEALRIFQFESSRNILDEKFIGGVLDFQDAIAASEGEVADWKARLEELFSTRLNSVKPAVVVPMPVQKEVISIFFDLPNFPEWRIFVKNDRLGLYLSDAYQLEIDAK